MPYKDPLKNREYQRKWAAKKLDEIKSDEESQAAREFRLRKNYYNKKHRIKKHEQVLDELWQIIKGETNENSVNKNQNE